MNAAGAALELLQEALDALGRHSHPTPKDVETALGFAKTATKILTHSNGLLGEGIFSITDEPAEGTPLPFEPAASIKGKQTRQVANA